jgi:acyl-CoA thioesterase
MSETYTDADQLAQAVSQAMYANDDASRLLDIKIIESRQGYARLSMIVKKEMTNGLDICHGGLIFTLADSAFAYACNSSNKATVAAKYNIEFMAPAAIDDELIAVARERSRAGRTGIYDVEINKQNGDLIALFRGKSYQIKGQVIHQSGEQ